RQERRRGRRPIQRFFAEAERVARSSRHHERLDLTDARGLTGRPRARPRELPLCPGRIALEERLPSLLDGRVEGAREALARIERKTVTRSPRRSSRACRPEREHRADGEREKAVTPGHACRE